MWKISQDQEFVSNLITMIFETFGWNIYKSIITFVLLKRTFKRFINHFYWLIRYACSSYNKVWGFFQYLPLQMRRRRKVRKPDLRVGNVSFDLVKGHHHSIISKNYFSLFSSNCLNERMKLPVSCVLLIKSYLNVQTFPRRQKFSSIRKCLTQMTL